MSAGDKVKVFNLKRVEVVGVEPPKDFGFVITDGADNKLGLAVTGEELGKLVRLMLNASTELTRDKAPTVPHQGKMTTTPIDATAFSFVPGRTPSEALLTLRCGVAQIAVAIDLEALL